MSKVNAHYERIGPRSGVRNSVQGVDSIVMCIVKVHSEWIDYRNGVSDSVSGVNPFIMRIYFAHVTGVNDRLGSNPSAVGVRRGDGMSIVRVILVSGLEFSEDLIQLISHWECY